MYYLLAQEFLDGILLSNWYIEDPITGKPLKYSFYSIAYAKAKAQCFEVNSREVRVFVVHSSINRID